MKKHNPNIPLNIFLNHRFVGKLERAPNGAVQFQYDNTWLEWEHTLPISLSLPLQSAPFKGMQVFSFFDNLLPDNDAIRKQLATRIGAKHHDMYSLLGHIGRDCVGALQFLPANIPFKPSDRILSHPVNDTEIEWQLLNLSTAPLGISWDQEFRISLAGAQEKMALLFYDNHWHIPHGTTATTHIIKPAIGKLKNGIDLSDSIENEFFCMQLTKAFGLPTAHTKIVTFNNTPTLIVERFDRKWTKDGRLLRLPQEDCCQALGISPSQKYQADGGPSIKQILQLLTICDDPLTNQSLFLKAQIMFWLLGASDGHGKNFSLFLTPKGIPTLTPLYDIMSSQPYVDKHQLMVKQMKLAMSVGDNRHYIIDKIAPRHFIQTALTCNLPTKMVEAIFAEIYETHTQAIEIALNLLPKNFPEALVRSIVQGFKKRLSLVHKIR